MNYFIVSEEYLTDLQLISIGFGALPDDEISHIHLGELKKIVANVREIEIPDYIDVIVGYSSPNPSHCTLWEREGDKIERMQDHDE